MRAWRWPVRLLIPAALVAGLVFDDRLDRADDGSDVIDDIRQVGRGDAVGLLQRLQRGRHSTAMGMAHNDNQARAEFFRGKLDAANLCAASDIAGHADGEQVADALVKDHFQRHTRIRATENDSKWILIRHGAVRCIGDGGVGGCGLVLRGRRRVPLARFAIVSRQEMPVAFPQSIQCFSCV